MTETEKKQIIKMVESYLDSRGLVPLTDEQQQLHDAQMKFVQSKVPAKSPKEVQDKLLSRYQRHMRHVLWDELKLADNQRFWAFLMDIAVNTCDLSKSYAQRFEVVNEKGKKQMREVTAAENEAQEVSLPLMDRFINLLLSLHKPDFHQDITYS